MSRGGHSGAGDDSPVVFVHIQKTAGTTMRAVARHNVRPAALWELRADDRGPDVDRLLAQVEERPGSVQLVMGHMGMGLGEAIPGGCRYLTVVRDPIRRYISHYHHGRRNAGTWMHEAAAAHPLEEFIDTDEGRRLANLQVSYLTSPRTLGPDGQPPNAAAPPVSQRVPEILGLGRPLEGTHQREDLDSAITNLDRCVALGVTERLEESLLLLQASLGWRRIHVARYGVAPSATAVRDGELHERIGELNHLDVLLYEAALERFQRRIDEELPDVQLQVRRLRQRSRVLGPIVRRTDQVARRARRLRAGSPGPGAR
jgi:hypothetical protein